jgi:predicted lipoprotein with Yx(FWY)xxD motif
VNCAVHGRPENAEAKNARSGKRSLSVYNPLNRLADEHVIRFMGSNWGSSLPRRSVSGIAGAALLVASGSIHLDLYLTGYRSIPTIGWLFLLQVIAAYVLAVAILVTGHRLAAAAGAAFALGTLGGYLLSLKVGLFGFTEVRTTAGIVAGIIDVAAFAALATALATAPVTAPVTAKPAGQDPGRRRVPAVAVAATAVVSVVALGLLGAAVATPKAAPAASVAAGSQALKARSIGGTEVLTNASGLTLYSFAPDTPSRSACYGSCAAYWPPVPGNVSAGPGVTGAIASIKRTGGSTQATYDGHPLYTYIGDSAPGQDSGNNLNLNGGLWRDVPVAAAG